MSIIFEALKKLESEKGPGDPDLVPLSFAAPATGRHAAPPRRSGARRALLLCSLTAAALLFSLLVRPDWWGIRAPQVPASPRPSASAAVRPVIKEVRFQPKRILPLEPAPPPPPSGEKNRPQAAARDAGGGGVSLPDLRLKGVSLGGRRSWAFINDKMLKAGDTIEGATVKEILSDRVILIYRGVEFTLGY